jgi:hypothetical protein
MEIFSMTYSTDCFIADKFQTFIYGKTTKELNRVINLTAYRCYRDLFTKKDKISLSFDIGKLHEKEQIWGSATMETKNDYLMELDGFMSIYSTIATLCHEMVHVNQYFRGDLKADAKGFYWLGTDMTEVAYCRQPWEKEAYMRQKLLTDLVIDEQIGFNRKWARKHMARNGQPIASMADYTVETPTGEIIVMDDYKHGKLDTTA